MKVGLVGATAACALTLRGSCSELMLTDKDATRAQAEAQDIAHAAPVSHGTRVSSGPLQALAGSAVVIVAAGASQQPDESRLALTGRNAAIFRDLTGSGGPRPGRRAPDCHQPGGHPDRPRHPPGAGARRAGLRDGA